MEENSIVRGYSWDEEEQTLTVYSNLGVKQFCEDYRLKLHEYNYKTIVDPSVEDCSNMFHGCESFNQHVEIPGSVTKCDTMFGNCESFNQPVSIPKSVRDCSNMFLNCESFDQPISIPESVEECNGMFYGCWAFNQSVDIPGLVKDCSYMFSHCSSLNQPITIPESVEECDGMFYGCTHFDQPVDIPKKIKDCSYMFIKCESFNQPIVIPDSVEFCDDMFSWCDNFDSPVIIPDGLKYSRDFIFRGAGKMRFDEQDIVSSLVAKAAKKILTHQDCQLTAEEANVAKQYKQQKNLVSALGSDEAVKSYEKEHPGALWTYKAYQFMFAEEQKKYAEKSRTDKFASVDCEQTGVDSKSNDKQLGD